MGNTPFAPCAATVLAAGSLLILPVIASAQAAPDRAPTHVVTAAQTPSAAQTPRQVEVTVDWVDIPETDVSTTNVGLGPNLDGRLMAALIQNGAIDAKGPRLRVTEGQFGSLHVRTDVPTSVAVDGRLQKTVLHLDNFIEATPQINPDGFITVTGGVQRQTLIPHIDPPAASTDYKMLQGGFRDGEPQLLGGFAAAGGGYGGNSTPKHFVFVTVTTVKDKTARGK